MSSPHERRHNGSLLAGPSLKSALEQDERILRNGSWEEAQLRGSGYDVRLDTESVIISGGSNQSRHQTIDSQGHYRAVVVLKPGESAVVATIEKFSLDFDVCATIGAKFRWAAKGLLMLHGTAIHPGFGRYRDEQSGKWLPKSSEKLYFVVANVGPGDIYLEAGSAIAYLQFYDIERCVEGDVPNVGYDELRRRFGYRDEGESEAAIESGLAYFRNVTDLKRVVEENQIEHTAQLEQMRNELQRKSDELTRQVTEARTDTDRVTNASNTVVVFGVFLVAATLLGVVVVTLFDVVEKLPDDLTGWKLGIVVGISVVFTIAVVFGVAAVARAAKKT